MTLTAAPIADEIRPSPAPAGGRWQALRAWAGDNRLFCVVLAVATVLRVVVEATYAPALEFFGDSPGYLHDAAHLGQLSAWHPFGYPLLLRLTAWTQSLVTITLLQHLLGLAAAVVVYRLARGFGVGRGLATVATLPLLLDAYQLDVEQFVLSDTLFTFLAVVCVVVCLRLLRQPSGRTAAMLGVLVAAATITRTVGLALALSVLLALLVARVGWRQITICFCAVAVPLFAYALAFHATYGTYSLEGYSGRYLYGIAAPVAQCRPDPLTDPLCPTTPPAARPGSNEYVWNLYPYLPLAGDAAQRSSEAGAFARRVALHEPGTFAATVAGNFVHYFAPTRTVGPRDWFVGSWQFPLTARSPAWNISPAVDGIGGGLSHASLHGGGARLLRDYQNLAFVPGPLLALCIIAGAIAWLAVRRDRMRASALLVLTTSGVLMLAVPAATAGFDWRYALPAQALLVPAGVIAMHELRPALRRRLGRVLPVATTAVLLAAVAPNVAWPSVYAAEKLRPAHVVTAPATQSIGGHLDVTLGKPTFFDTRCRWDKGTPRMGAYFEVPVAVRHRSGGPPMLVQSGNFGVGNGSVLASAPGLLTSAPSLPSVLMSSRFARTAGTLYAFTWSRKGLLRYVDPVGGGAAAWAYALQLPASVQLGARCTGTMPWTGVVVPSLHVTGVHPFTMSATQQLSYGLTREVWRARQFDLRFLAVSPTTGRAQPWQYPPTWQHTKLRHQALLQLVPGMTYCFSVRALDAFGAATDWSAPTCTTRLYDDSSLPPNPDWTALSGRSGLYAGTVTETATHGAIMSITVPFTRVALLLYHCPQCGSIDVFADSRLLGHLNLRSAGSALKLWSSRPLARIAQTLTLRVTSATGVVAIDGFALQDLSAPHRATAR